MMVLARALAVAVVLLALPAAAAPSVSYHLVRRQMELDIHSELEANLEVEDTLQQTTEQGLGRIEYRLPRVGPLLRFVVHNHTGGHGWASTTTMAQAARALQAFVRWHQDGVLPTATDRPTFPGETNPSLYPSGVAVVVREAGDDYAIKVVGKRPVVAVTYSFVVTGRGLVERSVPGLPTASIRSFLRFEVPGLNLEDGAQARLKVVVLPKVVSLPLTKRERAQGVMGSTKMLDDRHYWSTSVVKLPDGRQAVDVVPVGDDGSFEAHHHHLGVWDGPAEIKRPLYVTSLGVTFPPPKAAEYGFVDVAVDVAPARQAWMQTTLASLDNAHGVSLVSAYLAGAPPVKIDNYRPPLVLPRGRGRVEDLLRLVVKEGRSGPLVLFTDRPAVYAHLLARLQARQGTPVHLVDVRAENATAWRRILGRTSPAAAAIEATGGIWIELGSGEPLNSLWEHLVWPRWIDDLKLTVDGVPFALDGYLASAFTSSGAPTSVLRSLPTALPLGHSVSAVLIQGRPDKIPTRWELSGLVWAKPVTWYATLGDSYLPERLLRVSGALEQLAPSLRLPVQEYIAQWGEVLPGAPQAWIAPVPWQPTGQ
jgi:hypothetical protein